MDTFVYTFSLLDSHVRCTVLFLCNEVIIQDKKVNFLHPLLSSTTFLNFNAHSLEPDTQYRHRIPLLAPLGQHYFK